MKKLCLILIGILFFLFAQAQSKNTRIVLARNDTMHFETDSVFGFAINPLLKKSDSVWKRTDDIILKQFAKVIKSRCQVENLFCTILMYPPVCDWEPAKRMNIIDNIHSYLMYKCVIPQKYLYRVMSSDGGPMTIDYKGKSVPYLEIILTKEIP